MRGRPEHDTHELDSLLDECDDIEATIAADLPAASPALVAMSTDDLIIHLRVSWIVERLHRSGITTGDGRTQNAADVVAARDELARRSRAARTPNRSSGPSR